MSSRGVVMSSNNSVVRRLG